MRFQNMPKPSTKKWRFAIGTTSRVPNIKLHYLIADFDGINDPVSLGRRVFDLLWSRQSHFILQPKNFIFQQTPNGYHMYSNGVSNFGDLVFLLNTIGADPAWIEIGQKRGYYFLADKDEIDFWWPVEHMVLKYGKKKKA